MKVAACHVCDTPPPLFLHPDNTPNAVIILPEALSG